jgi:glyoxylase-like metal-dependent hydrolase (beta-lactamase superfamily II)
MSIKKLAGLIRLVLQRRAVNGKSFNEGEFKRWQIGDFRITKVVEMEGEGFGEFLIPDAQKKALAAIPWMHPSHLGINGGLKLSVHSFVIEAHGKRILIDTNVGNGKKRKVPIWNRMSMPWLDDLVRAGFPPESIDLVVCTHLHIDHVGWNTIKRGGHWAPTFPNARYVFVREEFEYWKDRLDDPARAELFADSITPIVAAGLADLVETDAQIVPGVRLILTPGHTEDHCSVAIESEGEKALITGDFIHHPAQFAHPEWSSGFDTSPDRSVATRLAMFEDLAANEVLLLGTAFPDPSSGYVRSTGTGFRFEPAC